MKRFALVGEQKHVFIQFKDCYLCQRGGGQVRLRSAETARFMIAGRLGSVVMLYLDSCEIVDNGLATAVDGWIEAKEVGRLKRVGVRNSVALRFERWQPHANLSEILGHMEYITLSERCERQRRTHVDCVTTQA